MSYTCAVNETIGNRISDMRLTASGEPLDASSTYVVGGWASVNEGVEGPAIYDLMEGYLTRLGTVNVPDEQSVKIVV